MRREESKTTQQQGDSAGRANIIMVTAEIMMIALIVGDCKRSVMRRFVIPHVEIYSSNLFHPVPAPPRTCVAGRRNCNKLPPTEGAACLDFHRSSPLTMSTTMSEDELESLVMTTTPSVSFLNSLVAGGLAGTTVDVALFPIDTIKTRLQSPQGFRAAGGFRGIYNGLGAAALGSAPGAAMFFSTYESMKPQILQIQQRYGMQNDALSHMIAASMGEAVACLVRVPTEGMILSNCNGDCPSKESYSYTVSTVVKAKMQTSTNSLSDTVKTVLNEPGGSLTGGLYRGYGITLLREIPFAMIQFPLYERFKVVWAHRQGFAATPLQAAICGSVSGGIAAAVTTPLDVIKTRIMLGTDKHGQRYKGGVDVIQKVLKQEGVAKLFSGLQPRVMWISIGGFVFLGSYEAYRNMMQPMLG